MNHTLYLLRTFLVVSCLCASAFARSATLSLAVKIDPPVHDCRFLPALSDTEGLAGITDVRMDLYENASKEFSFSLMHEEYADPLAPSKFMEAFSQFQLMADGYYADNLGYYHTTWHYYLLTVTFEDGQVLEAKSRPFRVPENPFHIFCAQIVNEPYMGSFTYKPGSSIIYQVDGIGSGSSSPVSSKKVADISKMADMYANWQTTWTDKALVFGQLPDEAASAGECKWTLTSSAGTIIDPIVSDAKENFSYAVTVNHFGEEDFNLSLSYTLADKQGNDSIVTVTNHQYIKMRLSTPCFAYDNAVYSKVTSDSEPTQIVLYPSDFSGLAAGGNFGSEDKPETLEDARLLHMDMLSYLQISPNMFSNTNIVLNIYVTDTKYPDDPSKKESRTYGPFLYTYSNAQTEVGTITLKDCRPSDWWIQDPATGEVTPVPHRLTVTYSSGTHEFYYAADKNSSLWQANPSFNTPGAAFANEPIAVFRRHPEKGWHECLLVPGLASYNAKTQYVNNRTSIPENLSGGGAKEYYAIATRWIGSGNEAFDFGGYDDETDLNPHLIPQEDFINEDAPKSFLTAKLRCGDGQYRPGIETTDWFPAYEYEAATGHVYLFAYSAEPVMEIAVGDTPLQLAAAPSKPRRSESTQRAEAFLPSMSSNVYQVGEVVTAINEIKSEGKGFRVEPGTVILEDSKASVYDTTGRCLASGKGSHSLPSGVYIVRTDERTSKILLPGF